MHILEVPSFFTPYGGEFCLDQAKSLASLGHKVRILSNVQLSVRKSFAEFVSMPYGRFYEMRDGIMVYSSYMRGIPMVVRPNVRRWIKIVRSMFVQYVKQYGMPDILHAHCAKWAGYAAMLISRDYGVPYVITEHLPKMILDKEFGKDYDRAWQVKMLKETYNSASLVIPVSKELVDELSPIFGCDYRWKWISNTIDTDFFCYKNRKVTEGRKFRFCCTANYIYRKGYDVLFEAFDKLYNVCHDVELYIAGKGTDGKDCLQAIEKLSARDSIVCCGNLDKEGVRSLLYKSDVMVLATRSEVQPLSILEAMSTGLPVISTECIPESLRIEDGCFIVPVNDSETLSETMHNVLNKKSFDGYKISENVKMLASKEIVGRKIEAAFLEITKQASGM